MNKDFFTSDEVSSFSLPKADSAAEEFTKRLNINLHFSVGRSFAYGVGLVESYFFFGIPTTVVSAPLVSLFFSFLGALKFHLYQAFPQDFDFSSSI